MALNLVDLKPISDWLHANPEWGIFMAFVFAFIESVAILGLIMPGAIMMSLIGVLLGAGYLPFTTTIIWAGIGGFIGDVLSFFIGYHYRGRLHQVWPFTRIPKLLAGGETFFANHGGKGIFIGRFIGPIRPMLPLIAGTLSMSIPRFLIVDLISAMVWAPVYMLPGIIIGAASLALAPHATSRILMFLVGLIVGGWILFWLVKNTFIFIVHQTNRLMETTWRWARTKPYLTKLRQLLTPHLPDDHTQFSLAIFFVIALVLFTLLVIAILDTDIVLNTNLAIYHFFRSLYNPTWHKIMVLLTLLYEPAGLAVVFVVVAFYLIWKKHNQAFLHWIAITCLSYGLGGIFKRLLDIPRPAGISYVPDSGSFPSGHVLMTACLFSFIAVLCKLDKKSFARYLSIFIAVISILLVSLSRLYLGAHWLSDVVGALLLATCIVLGVTVSYRRQNPMPIKAAPLLAIALISQLLTWSVIVGTSFDEKLADYSPEFPSYNVTVDEWWQYGLKHHPLFRNDRFGTPVQTLNVEWLGNISAIKENLMQQGWQAKFMSPLLRTLNYFGASDHSNLMPLFPIVYEGKKPILVMTKLIGNPKRLLVLRLWRSYANVTDNDYRIWVGTLNYQHNNRRNFLNPWAKMPAPPLINATPVTNAFSVYLKNYHWKKLDYSDLPRLNDSMDADWDGYVLLVRDK